MNLRRAAAALVSAVVLLGPAPAVWAEDPGPQHDRGRHHRCWDHDWDDDGYNGDYKYRSYQGDSPQDHNDTGEWRKRRCHQRCGKGERDWHSRGHHRCHGHGRGGHHHHSY